MFFCSIFKCKYYMCNKVFNNVPNKMGRIQPLKKFERILSVKTQQITSNFLRAAFRNIFMVHS